MAAGGRSQRGPATGPRGYGTVHTVSGLVQAVLFSGWDEFTDESLFLLLLLLLFSMVYDMHQLTLLSDQPLPHTTTD